MAIHYLYDNYCASYQRDGFTFIADPEAERITRFYTVAFLKAQLQADYEYNSYLTAAEARQNPNIVFFSQTKP